MFTLNHRSYYCLLKDTIKTMHIDDSYEGKLLRKLISFHSWLIVNKPMSYLQCNPKKTTKIESIPLAGRYGNTQTNKPLKYDNWGLSKLLSRGDC